MKRKVNKGGNTENPSFMNSVVHMRADFLFCFSLISFSFFLKGNTKDTNSFFSRKLHYFDFVLVFSKRVILVPHIHSSIENFIFFLLFTFLKLFIDIQTYFIFMFQLLSLIFSLYLLFCNHNIVFNNFFTSPPIY